MSNTAITAYEEERNANFQAIAAQVIAIRAQLSYMEQQMEDAYIGTTAYRKEQEQYAMMRFYWNDCTSDEINNTNNPK
ncbi:hypothetical protein [Taibaiella koreensis]|uniref:hypothetical protein n=1 Tax=Taibaiella koreensis TaxID=1268548 RepID=UPI000E59DC69|nr:hypothetical protein [Taibaiella koreensis]